MHVIKLFKGYLEQLSISAKKADYEKTKDEFTTTSEPLVRQKLQYMDIITKMNFVKNLLILRKLKFDWDVLYPATFRALMLKARWKIANNRQQVYALHSEILAEKEIKEVQESAEQDATEATSSFLQVTTEAQAKGPSPQFVLWGTSQVMEGSKIMGIDEQSFDPSTSGVGPPPGFPELPDKTVDAITSLKVVSKNAGAAMQAYLDYGEAPLSAVAKISWQQGIVPWGIGSVVLRVKYMLASVDEKLKNNVNDSKRAMLQLLFVRWFSTATFKATVWKKVYGWLPGIPIRLQQIKNTVNAQIAAQTAGDAGKAARWIRQVFFKLYPDFLAWYHWGLHVDIMITVKMQLMVEVDRQVMDKTFKLYKDGKPFSMEDAAEDFDGLHELD